MRSIRILFTTFILYFGTSCSDDQISNFLNTLAVLDEWSPRRPMTVFVHPFKPEDSWDPESIVGKLAWGGVVVGVQALEEFSSGKIKYSGMAEDSHNYRRILSAGSIYRGMARPDADKKYVLRTECNRRKSESLMYGVYNKSGDRLRLSVYMYVKKDNLIVKERDTIFSTERVADSLVVKAKAADDLDSMYLTESEKQLVIQLTSKGAQLSSDIVRKYLQGTN